mmetsp:Transcript_23941/g.37637  ORF Transcript_23941/g.37637 Transcript_23941/m.37637 type:complete len:212 (+) Transcript_23941:401-1036(+)
MCSTCPGSRSACTCSICPVRTYMATREQSLRRATSTYTLTGPEGTRLVGWKPETAFFLFWRCKKIRQPAHGRPLRPTIRLGLFFLFLKLVLFCIPFLSFQRFGFGIQEGLVLHQNLTRLQPIFADFGDKFFDGFHDGRHGLVDNLRCHSNLSISDCHIFVLERILACVIHQPGKDIPDIPDVIQGEQKVVEKSLDELASRQKKVFLDDLSP